MNKKKLNLDGIDFDKWANNWYKEKSKYPFWIDIKIKEPIKVNGILKINIFPCENIQLAHKYLTERKKQKKIYKEELCLIYEKLTKETAAQLTTALRVIEYAQKGLLTYEKIAYIIQVFLFHCDYLYNNFFNIDSILGGTWKDYDLNIDKERKEYIKYANNAIWKLEKILNVWNNNLSKYADGLFRTTDKQIAKIIYFTIPPRWITYDELPKIYKENDEFMPKEILWIDARYVPIVEEMLLKIKIKKEEIINEILDLDIELEQNVFMKDDNIWIIKYSGITIKLDDLDGLVYIHHLLSHPLESIKVSTLRKITIKVQPDKINDVHSKMTKDQLEKYNLSQTNSEMGISEIDDQAKIEYQKRIKRLKNELDDAKEFNNEERQMEILEELEFIKDELNSSINLKGEPRKIKDKKENLRKTISASIRYALNKIKERNEKLYIYLDKHIDTGKGCLYHPDPDNVINWKL